MLRPTDAAEPESRTATPGRHGLAARPKPVPVRLRPAKGVLLGLLISLVLWVLIAYAIS